MSHSRREGARVRYYEQYVLNYHGKNFNCFLENFSTSGMLVICEQISDESIVPGDDCTVTLSVAPSEIRCKVARQHHNQLGLEFSR